MARLMQLAELLDAELRMPPAEPMPEITGVASAKTASKSDLVFAEDANAFSDALASEAAAVIVAAKIAPEGTAGKPLLVVKQPRHPYTQLLIGSIPRVSTERNWASEPSPALEAAPGAGCKFADRCPAAMPRCVRTPPALFRVEPRRAVACHLYQGAEELPTDALAEVV